MLGRFTFHFSFRKCKIILFQNADNLRAKLEWLYKVVLKYVGVYLTLFFFAETIRNKTGYVKLSFEICGRNVFLFLFPFK